MKQYSNSGKKCNMKRSKKEKRIKLKWGDNPK